MEGSVTEEDCAEDKNEVSLEEEALIDERRLVEKGESLEEEDPI